jgi:hypothetical protein
VIALKFNINATKVMLPVFNIFFCNVTNLKSSNTIRQKDDKYHYTVATWSRNVSIGLI